MTTQGLVKLLVRETGCTANAASTALSICASSASYIGNIPTLTITDERTDAMWKMYDAGASLKEVGDQFGVSRERVRQLFVLAGYNPRPRGETKKLRRFEPAETFAEALNLWNTTFDSLEVIAEKLGLSYGNVKAYIRKNTTQKQRTSRRRLVAQNRDPHVRYTDEEMLDGIRACAEFLGRTPGAAAYTEFAKTHNLAYSITISNRFGSWNEAIIEAGFTPHCKPDKMGLPTYSEEDCESAVRRIAEKVGGRPSFREYDQHRLPSDPGAEMIRVRYGSWANALDIIL